SSSKIFSPQAFVYLKILHLERRAAGMALARPVRSNYRGSVTSFRTFSTAHAGSNSLSQPPSFRIKTSLLAELNPGLPQYFVLAPIPDPCTFTLPVLVGEFLFRRKLGILSLDFHGFESLPPLR